MGDVVQVEAVALVSPTSIRSRILKVELAGWTHDPTDVSPTSIRSRILKGSCPMTPRKTLKRFTHVDPFEDTERSSSASNCARRKVVSPTSIRSRILKGQIATPGNGATQWFHPRRSVRGY